MLNISSIFDWFVGRVDDCLEEEIRRLKAEEESRAEALKRDKTEVKKEVWTSFKIRMS